jgi:hypothetical protein
MTLAVRRCQLGGGSTLNPKIEELSEQLRICPFDLGETAREWEQGFDEETARQRDVLVGLTHQSEASRRLRSHPRLSQEPRLADPRLALDEHKPRQPQARPIDSLTKSSNLAFAADDPRFWALLV